ncbi:MAG: tRNA dihydrouridine synthase DusB [Pseudohongiellaceae bacterium]
MINIGPYTIHTPLLLAPMAGISDKPTREVCAAHGAGLTIAEMITSNVALWRTPKNRCRRIRAGTEGPHVVQIAGSDPDMMAHAARVNVEAGADIIDINMGCPAKKVLQKSAGSALLKSPDLVRRILVSVVKSVPVPVTLKIRTGWCSETRNGVEIAKLAEHCGVKMLSVHGRTRACRFRGEAEYDTIAAIKRAVRIPVIANGDITTPEKAAWVLKHTGADGLMIGRGAQGRPWIFAEIAHYLETGTHLPAKTPAQILPTLQIHLDKLYSLYGEERAVLIARKHVGWYTAALDSFSQTAPETIFPTHSQAIPQPASQGTSTAISDFRKTFNRLLTARQQQAAITGFFSGEAVTAEAA